MNLKPLRGYVLVEQIDDTEVRSSGLVMPETAKDKPMKGVIIEIGNPMLPNLSVETNHRFDTEFEGKVGDKVVFKKWATNDLEEDGKKLAFVKFEDILGVYE
jgi:chaperonin GroES